MKSDARLVLVRHGETEWSASGRHTGRTDLALTARGREDAQRLASTLAGFEFRAVFTSPLRRASETCAIAGFGPRATTDADLVEWDYGDLEGETTAQIQARRPGWNVFRDGCPGGESPADVTARVDRALARLRACAAGDGAGDVLVFGHGHALRALAARWLGLPVVEGQRLLLDTGTINVLGAWHGVPALQTWNARPR